MSPRGPTRTEARRAAGRVGSPDAGGAAHGTQGRDPERMIANKAGGGLRQAGLGTLSGRSSSQDTLTAEALDRAVDAARDRLIEDQHPDGYWVVELEGDTI